MRIPPRIIANLRESHFSCSALLTSSFHSSVAFLAFLRYASSASRGRNGGTKNAGKPASRVFLKGIRYTCFFKSCELLNPRKPATRVFQHFLRCRSGHAEPMRRSVGTRPRSETTRTRRQRKENADSRRFAIACKPKACVPPQAGFARLGLFAVRCLILPHLCHTRNRSTSKESRLNKFDSAHRGKGGANRPRAYSKASPPVSLYGGGGKRPLPQYTRRKGGRKTTAGVLEGFAPSRTPDKREEHPFLRPCPPFRVFR